MSLSGCATGGPRPSSPAQPTAAAAVPVAESVESLRLDAMDSRTSAEEAGADSRFPDLYYSVQARLNASMDAEERGDFDDALLGYQRCLGLYGTLARLADAQQLRDELALEHPVAWENPDWQEAGIYFEAAIDAFLADDARSSSSAERALALYERLAAALRSL